MKKGQIMSKEQRKKISEGHKGIKPSEEVIKKFTELQKKLWSNPEYRRRMSNVHKGKTSPMKGKHYSDDVRRRMSNSRKKYFSSLDNRKKLSQSHKGKPSQMKGKHHSEESKRIMSVSQKERYKLTSSWNKGKSASEETKRKLSLSHLGKKFPNRKYTYSKSAFQKGHKINLGRKHSEEFSRKVGLIHKGMKHSDETKRKLSLSHLGKKVSERTKIKISQTWRKPEFQKIAKERREKQIFPLKDSFPEVKIQNILKQMGVAFLTHRNMKEIEHRYQCDIFIPSSNLIIECDGNYWHKYPKGNEKDYIRTKELIEKGFKVLRLWESDINNDTEGCVNKIKEVLKEQV